MNTFTIETRGDLTRIQYGDEAHIVCTAAELAQLRELLAPMAWQEQPSGEGHYVWRSVYGHYDEIEVSALGDVSINWVGRWLVKKGKIGGLWLRLPDVPQVNAA